MFVLRLWKALGTGCDLRIPLVSPGMAFYLLSWHFVELVLFWILSKIKFMYRFSKNLMHFQ